MSGSSRDPETLMRIYLDEVLIRGRLDLIDELAHPNVIDEANQLFGGPPGRAGLVAHVKGFRRNISDLKVHVERVVGNADTAMGWWSFAGVHTGPWLGRTPTNRAIEATVFSVFDVVEGRISRYRVWMYAGFDEPVVLDTSRSSS